MYGMLEKLTLDTKLRIQIMLQPLSMTKIENVFEKNVFIPYNWMNQFCWLLCTYERPEYASIVYGITNA